MSWSFGTSSVAVVEALEAALPSVMIFDRPPATFNPPCVILGRPALILFNSPTFGVDLATWPLQCVVGLEQDDRLAELLADVAAAIDADPSLFGTVQSARAVSAQGWRALDIAGINVLAADLTLEIAQ